MSNHVHSSVLISGFSTVPIRYFAPKLSFAENLRVFSEEEGGDNNNSRNSSEGHYRWNHTRFVSFHSVLQLQPSRFSAFKLLCPATFPNNQPIFFHVMLRVLNNFLKSVIKPLYYFRKFELGKKKNHTQKREILCYIAGGCHLAIRGDLDPARA